uniref:Uncharacterized protein n=1 Tax=Manihot esculenta TaxID=3983 RepID=A0A2C9WBH4_MANES
MFFVGLPNGLSKFPINLAPTLPISSILNLLAFGSEILLIYSSVFDSILSSFDWLSPLPVLPKFISRRGSDSLLGLGFFGPQ